MDVIYQAIVLKTFYPGEAVIVALALAFLPYLLLRGPIARIARRYAAKAPRTKSAEYLKAPEGTNDRRGAESRNMANLKSQR